MCKIILDKNISMVYKVIMRYYLIIVLVLLLNCGGGGGSSSDSSKTAASIPDPPEIITITFYEWMDYASNPNPTPLPVYGYFPIGEIVVWEVCANITAGESSLIEFSLYWPTPFVGNPTYFFSYGPFTNTADFMCFTNFTTRAMAMDDGWIVEGPIGDWLLSFRVIDSLNQESFPFEEIYRIGR